MTQADRVHSTPPTNTPIDTTRRGFLGGTAAALAASTAVNVAALATIRPAAASPATIAIAAPGSPLDCPKPARRFVMRFGHLAIFTTLWRPLRRGSLKPIGRPGRGRTTILSRPEAGSQTLGAQVL